jgi:hypothetical protein
MTVRTPRIVAPPPAHPPGGPARQASPHVASAVQASMAMPAPRPVAPHVAASLARHAPNVANGGAGKTSAVQAKPVAPVPSPVPPRAARVIQPSEKPPEATSSSEKIKIWACTRPVAGKGAENSTHSSTLGGPTHCYAKMTNSDGSKDLDSYSYFQDSGPYKEVSLTGHCELVMEGTPEDWEKLKSKIGSIPKEDYSLTEQNC